MTKKVEYVYSKTRKGFGKQPMFCEVPNHMIDSISPNRFEQKHYCLRNPVNSWTQTSVFFTENIVNTTRIFHHDQGINHLEGGWSKDINVTDEEAIMRYKRRIERDDSYINAILGCYSKFEHMIKQNNAIDMYTMYFKEMRSEKPVEKSKIVVNGIYRDIYHRPISSMDWTNEEHPKVVVSYCKKIFNILSSNNSNIVCFVWDLEKMNGPLCTFSPPSACWQVASSPRESSIIIGGLQDGRVCIFDIRAMEKPTLISPAHLAHREPVSALLNILSRTNNEFFTGSTDGKCMWWDSRNLEEPLDTLIISSRRNPDADVSLANAEPISVLQYERSIPTKFLCGTDTGLVINVNRKGRTHNDKMSTIYKAHNGSVKAVHRSPCTSKIFMTCGDWNVKIWNEDLSFSPIMSNTNHLNLISDVAWAPNRFSSYMTISSDGKLRYWDLLRKHHSPIAILPISKKPLLKMNVHREGKLVAIGDSGGELYITSLSDSLVIPDERDKLLMTQTFERETRRERILEMRTKEIYLKAKTDKQIRTTVQPFEDAFALKDVEENFKRIVHKENEQIGGRRIH
ncbi:unnamed protein product [Parnassius apollo]|uniref:(apollo) hypothetical protein n=1 Tax=Parnassius apollo TaxID=110799 RepID=A0A8S3Y2A7_PARAO|nr:unnamed protein product [Parnassius apollo]